ncbi:GNAT family N-acetyltransferase [Liberiplasma polymorphum]|uniref:GNAT family N-acetyltransferase n=1 Tax=Liberiplasma polymorphum TaxID=3374570 RepID=UPI003771107A
MIKPLSKEKYKDYPLHFAYETIEYYDVSINEEDNQFTVIFTKEKFDSPIKKTFDSKLFQPYLENPTAYGYFIDEKIVGVLEVNFDSWSKRLRVTELLIDIQYRRHGIGKTLMNQAKKFAKELGARSIILETQTCNTKAIDFYRSQGFKLIGFDSTCYSNNDIENKEVRVELGFNI